jgi:hypothetical protein
MALGKVFFLKKRKKLCRVLAQGHSAKLKKNILPSAGRALGKVTGNVRWSDGANILPSAVHGTWQNIKIFCRLPR